MIGSIVNHLGEEAVITTFPLGVNRLHIYTLKDTASISRYSELDGKVIGGLLGYEFFYQQITGRGLSIQYIADEQNLLKMLKAGRIDAALGFMPDWIPFLDSLTYDPNFIIHNGYDYMTVWNTPEGKIFVHKISIALQSMKADGSLAKILGERYMDFDYTKLKLYEWDPEQAL